MFFAIIGWIVVTGVLLWITLWYVGLHFTAVAFAGWNSLKDGWYWSVAWLVLLVVLWWGWWHFVAAALDISIKIN